MQYLSKYRAVLFTAPLSAVPLAESGFLAAVSYRCNYEYDCSVNRIDLYCQFACTTKLWNTCQVFSFWSLWVTAIPPRSQGPEDREPAGLFSVLQMMVSQRSLSGLRERNPAAFIHLTSWFGSTCVDCKFSSCADSVVHFLHLTV